jgi:hypothetical protein
MKTKQKSQVKPMFWEIAQNTGSTGDEDKTEITSRASVLGNSPKHWVYW